MNKEQYTYIIRYGVAAAAVAALCAPVVWRTEAMPSVSDVWGYRAVAALAVLALTAVCLGRRLPRLHWADGVALFWWVYVSLNYVFVSPYPAAEVYGKAMALGVAYVALRLVIPFCGRAFTRLWWVGLCAVGGYELWTGFMQLAGREASRHHLFDVTGTFFNPGPCAIFVAVVLAVSVAVVQAWRGLCRAWPVELGGGLERGGCGGFFAFPYWSPRGAARPGWLWRWQRPACCGRHIGGWCFGEWAWRCVPAWRLTS